MIVLDSAGFTASKPLTASFRLHRYRVEADGVTAREVKTGEVLDLREHGVERAEPGTLLWKAGDP